MSKISIKINTQLNTILQDENFDNFHVTQLRDAYVANSSVTQDLIEARKYVYRQILRLVKKGLLLKKGTKNSKTLVYHKSELFFNAKFIVKSTAVATANQAKPTAAITSSVIQRLEDRLKESQVDLFTSIGESKEYMHLYQSFPEMKTYLEFQYIQARENSSKLLGQIKAIKSVIAHQQKQP
ncbi:response regulator [Shewanella sp. UCD-KL12]|uniref:response regulator n=1 Tax=Shewanella sp. UCD-KL12 TaxID=1917163 RepID=UPI0009710B43|nr:response regulator [Shewanella sp. UCD-KL12]